MNTSNRSIFRSDAVQRYIEARQKDVLPRFARPRMFVFMWLLLGLLVASGVAAWLTQVPIYAAGVGVVVEEGDLSSLSSSEDGVAVMAFLPAEQLAALHAGQTMFLPLSTGERLSLSVAAVESEIVSPAAAEKQFGLTEGAAMALRQPSAVVRAHFSPDSPDSPDSMTWAASAYVGTVYRVEVEVGSRRIASLLPVVGHFFEE